MPRRSRALYALAVVLAIAAGLASRHFRGWIPPMFGKYPGDVLWALMVFWGWGLICASASSKRVAALALCTALAVELLKLVQLPWLVSARHTTLGHLVFGHVFSWQNLVAYALGVGLGFVLERLFFASRLQ